MDKISEAAYDTLYKFRVSLGLILVIVSVAPYYSKLVTAKTITWKSIQIKNLLSNPIYVRHLLLFTIGIIFIVFGMYHWNSFQKEELKRSRNETRIQEKELDDEAKKTYIESTDKEEQNETEFKAENKVLIQINHIFSRSYLVKNNFKFGNKQEDSEQFESESGSELVYDAVVFSNDKKQNNIIFETKYLPGNLEDEVQKKRIDENILYIYKLANYFFENYYHPRVSKVLIIVTEENEVDNLKDIVDQKLEGTPIEYKVISLETEDLAIKKFIKKVGKKNKYKVK